jgi:hypothetical protein
MTNIYGIEPESAGRVTVEASEPVCPYCHGHHTEFIDFEFTDIDDLTHEKHFCYECQIPFDIAYDIPYLRRQTCSQNSR